MISRFLILAALFAGGATSVLGQPSPPTPPEGDSTAAVRATIDALFDGMRNADSAAVRRVFHPDARLQTARGREDSAAVQSTSLESFARAVGQADGKTWDERIWNVQIRIDGPLATAWVPYAFYHGDALSHCGVNAMQLIRQADGWRILQITDTRTKECTIPPQIRK